MATTIRRIYMKEAKVRSRAIIWTQPSNIDACNPSSVLKGQPHIHFLFPILICVKWGYMLQSIKLYHTLFGSDHCLWIMNKTCYIKIHVLDAKQYGSIISISEMKKLRPKYVSSLLKGHTAKTEQRTSEILGLPDSTALTVNWYTLTPPFTEQQTTKHFSDQLLASLISQPTVRRRLVIARWVDSFWCNYFRTMDIWIGTQNIQLQRLLVDFREITSLSLYFFFQSFIFHKGLLFLIGKIDHQVSIVDWVKD